MTVVVKYFVIAAGVLGIGAVFAFRKVQDLIPDIPKIPNPFDPDTFKTDLVTCETRYHEGGFDQECCDDWGPTHPALCDSRPTVPPPGACNIVREAGSNRIASFQEDCDGVKVPNDGQDYDDNDPYWDDPNNFVTIYPPLEAGTTADLPDIEGGWDYTPFSPDIGQSFFPFQRAPVIGAPSYLQVLKDFKFKYFDAGNNNYYQVQNGYQCEWKPHQWDYFDYAWDSIPNALQKLFFSPEQWMKSCYGNSLQSLPDRIANSFKDTPFTDGVPDQGLPGSPFYGGM